MIPSSEERTMAMLCHLLLLFTGFVGPLVVWVIKKDQSEFVDRHGKEALNFGITVTIGYVLCWILAFILIGFLLMFVLGIIALIFVIMASVKAYEGGEWKYPISFAFIK